MVAIIVSKYVEQPDYYPPMWKQKHRGKTRITVAEVAYTKLIITTTLEKMVVPQICKGFKIHGKGPRDDAEMDRST